MSVSNKQSSNSVKISAHWNSNIAALSLFARPLAVILKSRKNSGIIKKLHCSDGLLIDTEKSIDLTDSATFDLESAIADFSQIVILGSGSGYYIESCLALNKKLVVVEPETALLNHLFTQRDFSQAIAKGQLHILTANCSNPAMEVVSLQSCTLDLQQFYTQWKNNFTLLKSGSYLIHNHFFDAILQAANVWKRLSGACSKLSADCIDTENNLGIIPQPATYNRTTNLNTLSTLTKASSPLSDGQGGSQKKVEKDVLIITPRCHIFFDLAYAFKEIGLKAYVVSTPDNGENSSQADERLLKLIEENHSQLVISRNRSAFETSNARERSRLEQHIQAPIVNWWWDTPNIASIIDMDDRWTRQPHLAFARDLLRVLPAGSQWLPAGAQSRFCNPNFISAHNEEQAIDISFVGQSRTKLLINNVSIFIKSIADVVDPKYNNLIQEFNSLSGLTAIHTFLVNIEKEISPTLEEVSHQWPKQVYYLRYILDMCITGAFRMAAIQHLINAGFNVQVFGDSGWVDHRIIPPNYYKGPIEAESLPTLYRQSKINLNLNFMQVSSAINPKVLDISACGGTVLSDHRPEVDYLYPDPALRPFTFTSLEELPERVSQLLSLDLTDHRQRLAEFTQQQHSLTKRAEWIAQLYGLGG